MAKNEHTTELTIENRAVVITTRPVKHSIKKRMRNYFGKYGIGQETGRFEDIEIPIGGIEGIAIDESLTGLRVGTTDVKFTSPDKVDDFPLIGMGGEEDEPDLYEEVLKAIIATPGNRFLAVKYPFLMVFGQYLAEEEAEAQEFDSDEDDEEGKATQTSTNSETEGTSGVTRLSGSELTNDKT